MKVVAALLVSIAAHASPASAQLAAHTPERHTVVVDGHPIAVWSRRPASPSATVLLVHGRTWSARPDWDLQVAGEDRSVLRSLAARGIAAYALDLRGYGETPRDTTGWNTPRRSTQDVLAVLAWIRQQHPRLPNPTLVGWSRGGAVAMMAAQFNPSAMSAVVFFGFSWDPEGELPEIDDLPGPPAKLPNTAEAAASDFISPRVTSPAVVKAFVAQALRADPVLADLKGDNEYRVLAPARVTVPALVIFGSRDPAYSREGAQRFVAALSTSVKRLVVLTGADHAAQLEDTHVGWVNAVATFARTPR